MSKEKYTNYSSKVGNAKADETRIPEPTNEVPEGALDANEDGTVNVYDEDNNKVGTIPEETAEAVASFEEPEVENVTDKIGEVTGCIKLRMRKDPDVDAPIVCIINAGTKVLIDEEGSTDKYYKVCTESVAEGYCMKEYITVNN